MTKKQLLQSELQDKIEYLKWLMKDIEETMNLIDSMEGEHREATIQ